MPQQMGFLRQRHKEKASASTLAHYGECVADNERWYLALVAFSNDASSNADIVVSIDGHGYDHVIGSEINMTKEEWYFFRPQLWLEAGERLRFYWDDLTNTPSCEVCVTGHIQYFCRKQED